MQLEIGNVYDGKVKSIAVYGVFVDIVGGGSGMVHISEIASTYVNEIRDHLTENQDVKVKVIGINEAGKVSLSIKKAAPTPPPSAPRPKPPRREDRPRGNVWEPKKQVPMNELGFEDMMSRFKQNSEDRMCDIKRGTDRKNGYRRK